MTQDEYTAAMVQAAADYDAACAAAKTAYDEQRTRIQAEYDGSDFRAKLRNPDDSDAPA